jgi:calreticulin
MLAAASKINDPNASKPSDWDDRSKIDDPEDEVKPEPAGTPFRRRSSRRLDATKPDDWDDELDGEWEAPQD